MHTEISKNVHVVKLVRVRGRLTAIGVARCGMLGVLIYNLTGLNIVMINRLVDYLCPLCYVATIPTQVIRTLELVLSAEIQAHEFPLICHCVISVEYRVFLEHGRGQVALEYITVTECWVISATEFFFVVTMLHVNAKPYSRQEKNLYQN